MKTWTQPNIKAIIVLHCANPFMVLKLSRRWRNDTKRNAHWNARNGLKKEVIQIRRSMDMSKRFCRGKISSSYHVIWFKSGLGKPLHEHQSMKSKWGPQEGGGVILRPSPAIELRCFGVMISWEKLLAIYVDTWWSFCEAHFANVRWSPYFVIERMGSATAALRSGS